eukprot:364938-Chlamydomonas_euryale.AAC.42
MGQQRDGKAKGWDSKGTAKGWDNKGMGQQRVGREEGPSKAAVGRLRAAESTLPGSAEGCCALAACAPATPAADCIHPARCNHAAGLWDVHRRRCCVREPKV